VSAGDSFFLPILMRGGHEMRPYVVFLTLFLIMVLVLSCASLETLLSEDVLIATEQSEPEALFTTTPESIPTPEPEMPPVTGSDPSYQVAAFYYPWYRNQDVDGYWDHWDETNFQPPLDISSDYYPLLGAYSVADPAVLGQHFAWLREAGIGVIISSWWGQGSREDQVLPLLLDIAEYYGVKVAFHIEPYPGRTSERLVEDVKYLYDQYGNHPAFFRTQKQSRWSPDARSKGLFFIWAITVRDHNSPEVVAGYWQAAVDEIHDLPSGGLVIANTTASEWVDGGHFDGLYNYATLSLDENRGFSWARSLPPDAWFVPSVLPGFSARRIGYSADIYLPRDNGATYAGQWQAALDTAIEPAMVTITSFNEWHEGSQIEPAAEEMTNGGEYTYADYENLPADGYLTLTREWGSRLREASWPEVYRLRIRIITTSDWTNVGLITGGDWMRPDILSVSEAADLAKMEGTRLRLTQPISRAEEGGQVEFSVDLLLTYLEKGEELVFEIERGHLGATKVEFYEYVGGEPQLVDSFLWAEINPGERNTETFQVSADDLVGQKD
jgi:hypothetical protein